MRTGGTCSGLVVESPCPFGCRELRAAARTSQGAVGIIQEQRDGGLHPAGSLWPDDEKWLLWMEFEGREDRICRWIDNRERECRIQDDARALDFTG